MTGQPTAGDIPPTLVEQAKAGEPDALRSLVERAYPLVRRWTLVRMGDPSEADDLTQDVLVLMIQRLDGFTGSARFTTWLYAVTRNAATDRFRRQDRVRKVREDPATVHALSPSPSEDPADAADRSLVGRVVTHFFEELPTRQREVFDLVELQGIPAVEAARLLGIEAVSVRAHLFKARRALRKRILASHPELAEEWT